MMQLLLERNQSYADIGSLLGQEVGEVRARARAALTEVGGSNPDTDVGLTDYLLGQADPIGRADAARHLSSDAGANAEARKLASQLQLIAPEADLPEIPAPAEREPRRRKAAAATEPPAGSATATQPAKTTGAKTGEPAGTGAGSGAASSLSSKQRTVIAALLAGGALLIVVVILIAGSGGDDSSDGNSGVGDVGTTGQETTDGETTSDPGDGGVELTRAVLAPPDGGDPQGAAIFGRLRNVPVIELTAGGLEPPGPGENYSVWLYQSDEVALRITRVAQVGEQGQILSQFPVPAEALGFVANGAFSQIVVSLTNEDEYRAELRAASQAEPPRLPGFIGAKALVGDIVGPGTEIGDQSGATGATGAAPDGG